MAIPPILENKDPSGPSVFMPAALMREARRQKNIEAVGVPSVCLLDPDGDLLRHLRRTGRARPFGGWPCYHTELDVFSLAGREVGIVGRAVGASFAVLVAEELFASGCRLLVSLTSAGQIVAAGEPPYFIMGRCATKERATIMFRLRSTPPLVLTCWKSRKRQSNTAHRELSRAQVGPRMPRSARPARPFKQPRTGEYLRSRWKRPRCTPSPPPREARFSASLT
ncbi:hypothetical protein ABIC02_006300 [Bradyrhizobium sp. RT5a]